MDEAVDRRRWPRPELRRGAGAVDVPVLAAGAAGARMGPSFIAAAAANAHPRYLAALIAARPENTIYSRAFTAWWDAPGRALRSCVEAATAFRGEVVGETPSLEATRTPVTRFAPEVADRETTGAMEAMPL